MPPTAEIDPFEEIITNLNAKEQAEWAGQEDWDAKPKKMNVFDLIADATNERNAFANQHRLLEEKKAGPDWKESMLQGLNNQASQAIQNLQVKSCGGGCGK